MNLSEYNYLYDYKPNTCRPISGRAFNLSCQYGDEELMHRWISVMMLERGSDAVENPFAIRTNRLDAIADRDKIEMLGNYSCLCRKNNDSTVIKGCSYWPVCILNADFIHYMQRDNDRYYQTYISFIVASVVSLVLSVISVPFSIMIIRQVFRDEYVPLE